MNTHPTELVRKGRKFDQVLQGAQDVFMREGYDRANVDDIAKVAGVSKATLYSYFADKRALFAAVAQAACEEQTQLALRFADEEGDFSERLYKGCCSFMEFIYSPFGIQMFRAVINEAANFPEFGRSFWATGPQMAHDQMVTLFREAIVDGDLKPIDDLELAAETLTELCKVYLHPRLLLGVMQQPAPGDIERIAKNAVETFMARFGI